MSLVASNKVRIARLLGGKIQPGWITDTEGNPVMEETDVPETFTLLPLGSTRELGSHKGYGLAGVVDILAGVLTGFGFGSVPGRPNFGHYVAAYNIEAFTDLDGFKEMMDQWRKDVEGHQAGAGPGTGAGCRAARG